MKKLKICFNVNNKTKQIDYDLPIYFVFVDKDFIQRSTTPNSLEYIVGFSYLKAHDICYFMNDRMRYITVGDNGVTTRVVKDIDKKEEKQLLLEIIEKNSRILKKLDEEYLDIIIDQTIMN